MPTKVRGMHQTQAMTSRLFASNQTLREISFYQTIS